MPIERVGARRTRVMQIRSCDSHTPVAVGRAVRAGQNHLVTIRIAEPDLPRIRAAIAVLGIAMTRHDHLGVQGRRTADRCLKIVDLKLQQHAISRRLVQGIANRSVIVVHFPAVQL